MTKARLTLEGHAPLDGTVEIGGDYIRFRPGGQADADALTRLEKGQIEIDGRTEKVMLKNVTAGQGGTGDDNGNGTLDLTLQRFTPSAGDGI